MNQNIRKRAAALACMALLCMSLLGGGDATVQVTLTEQTPT